MTTFKGSDPAWPTACCVTAEPYSWDSNPLVQQDVPEGDRYAKRDRRFRSRRWASSSRMVQRDLNRRPPLLAKPPSLEAQLSAPFGAGALDDARRGARCPRPRDGQSHQNGHSSWSTSSEAYSRMEPGPCWMLSGQKAKCSAAIAVAEARSRGGRPTARVRVSLLSPTT